MRSWASGLLLLLHLAGAGLARAEEPELPPRSQALLLMRVLAYDRTLARRGLEAVTIAVAWRTGDEVRRDAVVDAIRDLAAHYRVAGRPVRAVPVRYDPEVFEERLRGADATAVLVVGGLVREGPELSRLFQGMQLLSAATRREAMDQGMAIGLLSRGDHAGVVVNLAAARATGADFDSTLFTVAELLSPPGSL